MRIQRLFTDARTALLATLALAIAGCGDSSVLGVDQGRVQFVLSSDATVVAPDLAETVSPSLRGGEGGVTASGSLHDGEEHGRDHRYFQSANVTFSSILARNLDGVLVDVAMELPATIDVNVMELGREIVLPDGELPPAVYDQLVVVMTEVEGVMRDGTTITIGPPGGGWTAIVPVCPFTVEEGSTTVVGLRFNLRKAFKWWNNRFHFQPRFWCDADEEPESD